MMNLHADQVPHLQVVAIELVTGGVGTIKYPELRQKIEAGGVEALAHKINSLGFVAVAEPIIKLGLEASVIHPGYLTSTQLLLTRGVR